MLNISTAGTGEVQPYMIWMLISLWCHTFMLSIPLFARFQRRCRDQSCDCESIIRLPMALSAAIGLLEVKFLPGYLALQMALLGAIATTNMPAAIVTFLWGVFCVWAFGWLIAHRTSLA